MGVCDQQVYTCGETRPADKDRSIGSRRTISTNRTISLSVGETSLILAQRKRNYSFEGMDITNYTNYRWIGVPNEGLYSPCYDMTQATQAVISESYETVDTVLSFLDLREDCAVYTKTTKKMQFGDTRTFKIPLQTSFDDAYLYPFIFEEIPIEQKVEVVLMVGITNTVLYEATSQLGYQDDVNVLMPMFSTGSTPRANYFTLPALPPYRLTEKSYRADLVDWYYPPDHTSTDGDMMLYYPRWIKSVPLFDEIEAKEAELKWQQQIGSLPNNYSYNLSVDLHADKYFNGSVAFDKYSNMLANTNIPAGTYVTKLKNKSGGEYDVSNIIPSELVLHYPIGVY